MKRMPLPTIWFNKSFSGTLQQIRALAGHARVIASHTSADSIMLRGDHDAFLEPRGLVGEAYAEYCLSVCRARGVDVFFAQKEMAALAARREDFETQGTRLIVAGTPQTLALLDDKAAFSATFPAEPLGTRVPETFTVTTWPQMQAAILDLRTRHAGVCMKPARGVYAAGFRVLTEREDLRRFLAGDVFFMSEAQAHLLYSAQPEFPATLVMEHLPGLERSVDCVAWAGDLAGAVVRAKVGGGVQELQDHPALLDVVRRMTRHYGLSGLFNVQFKEDVTGAPCVLEVNPRAAGGLATSMVSGLNFPWVAVQLALGLITPADVPAPRTGLRVTEVKDVLELTDAPLRALLPADEQLA